MTAPDAHRDSTSPETGESVERALARSVLVAAASGGMPATFWQSDSRIAAACAVLGVDVAEGRAWAFEVAPSRPSGDELLHEPTGT